MGPRFDRLDGPLVAVCGLVGGAGASTLALALARQAAAASQAPVLLTETSSERAGLAVLLRQTSRWCLRELAAQATARGSEHGSDARGAENSPSSPFIELDGGPRLVASAPRRAPAVEPEELRQVLRDARAAHGLVVVDCGALFSEDGWVLSEASHIVWVLPASRGAVRGGQMLFAGRLLPPPGRARELLAACALQPHEQTRVRDLRRLAEHRCERLALVPYSPRLARGELDGLADLSDAIAAISGLMPQTR